MLMLSVYDKTVFHERTNVNFQITVVVLYKLESLQTGNWMDTFSVTLFFILAFVESSHVFFLLSGKHPELPFHVKH